MKRLWSWLSSRSRNDLVFWLGLALLCLGVSLTVSIATGLLWTGAVMIVDGMVSSYLEAWLMTRKVN